MAMGFKKSFVCWVFICSIVLFTGCSEPEREMAPEFLIKTPSQIISSEDFLEELDLKRAAYPYNIKENPAEYNEMVIYLVKMQSEEIVLLSAAAGKGVTVTDAEVQLAEEEFKKDYPEDSFEQILLKNALSYSFWKKRFRKNLIIDKLIDQELRQKIEITSQDIVAFYNKSLADSTKDSEDESALKKIDNENELVSRLRMQKAQDLYDDWIQQLRNDYPVEVNKEKLKTFLIDIGKSEENKNENKN